MLTTPVSRGTGTHATNCKCQPPPAEPKHLPATQPIEQEEHERGIQRVTPGYVEEPPRLTNDQGWRLRGGRGRIGT
jgi:hypothetical protein